MQFTTALVTAVAAFAMVQPIAAGGVVKTIFGKRSMIRGESNVFERTAPPAPANDIDNPVAICFEQGHSTTIHVKSVGKDAWTVTNVPEGCLQLAQHVSGTNNPQIGKVVVNADKSVTISDLPADEVDEFRTWAAGHP
ncbi:hypothetical protein M430DRAFT_21858 [Amorphotheca resinae ATCC 22711]|uniref:Uncharacterized protein n=1 Tax=Amorphotheca resinae ATCC 22711 TaxID=857342 RepID=A0A2T3ASM3_AMORE|nr:hypothetical protein M430DRAFT_21858 [Amorphotheca resinae ATCC 22711]PSS10494.1 hypothetical protein M430DRAFT_21858 [Amorphotheca resinae ATCC 22711]